MNLPASPSRRRFRRISLRVFLLLATIVMIIVGYYLSRIRRQRIAVRIIEKNGGQVFYDYHVYGKPTRELRWAVARR